MRVMMENKSTVEELETSCHSAEPESLSLDLESSSESALEPTEYSKSSRNCTTTTRRITENRIRNRHRQQNNQTNSLLIPSQSIHHDVPLSNISSPSKHKVHNKTIINNNYNQKRTKKSQQNKKTKKEKKKHGLQMTGDYPDIHWRAIPMEHLREHPLFIPLPIPDQITHLKYLEDVRYFRQDSWQWDALHSGRCTTSQVAPALGFLEPMAAKALGIPRSLQKGCMGAFHRFKKPALTTLKEMNNVLIEAKRGNSISTHIDKTSHTPNHDVRLDAKTSIIHEGQQNMGKDDKIWTTNTSHKFPFKAKYIPQISKKMQGEKFKKLLSIDPQLEKSPMAIRMGWGNAQEATAILTALNYLSKTHPGVRIREVGMCGAGLEFNATVGNHELLVGASPDAVIEYANGTLEALEVKNHCPFVPMSWFVPRKRRSSLKLKNNDDAFFIREMPLTSSVPPLYLPQLMMEMMCLGPQCKSAIMVRQTATNGAMILRLNRDKEWIDEMMYWLKRFVTDYVNEDKPPPDNFFWNCNTPEISKNDDELRYRSFVKRTKELADGVEFVDHVGHSAIQRVLSDSKNTLPLFLDQKL